MEHILIVEDEAVIRTALRRLLERNNYQVSEAGSVSEALKNINKHSFDLIISDLRLPGAPGTDLIKQVDSTPVLIMTSYASMKSAVDSLKSGAVDYIAKPFDHDNLLQSVANIISQHSPNKHPKNTTATQHRGQPQLGNMLGSCKPMLELYEHIKKVAPTDTTVLVHGETGTGKELVATSIHKLSSRANKPIICVNCAAIPETLIESELFGYEKGAFTGAHTNRMGLIEAADGGTLFLDEIGELPLEAQARLLRFIQEDEVRRIGATQTMKVDVRLICATHRDLKHLAEQNLFRPDLYYRINVMQLVLPPLRNRGKDILEIAETLLGRCSEEHHKGPMHLSPKAVQAITTYHWPGNVRELENVISRAVILTEGDEIGDELLNIDLQLVHVNQLRKPLNKDDLLHFEAAPQTSPFANNPFANTAFPNNGANVPAPTKDSLSLDDYFQHFVLEHQDSMNETELAKKLGVSRKCLWERRQRLGIPRKKTNKQA